ncbi:MAG: twin-arginine translocase TatA/TatE family subunit [Planctomycetota bacterium]
MPHTLALFNDVGGGEVLLISIVALLLFGKNLPTVSRKAGRIIASFKRGIAEASGEINREIRAAADAMEKVKSDSIASADISSQISEIDEVVLRNTNLNSDEQFPDKAAPTTGDQLLPGWTRQSNNDNVSPR